MVNLYLLGKKGFIALEKLNKTHLNLISYVIVGYDKSVVNDYSDDIIRKCNELNLSYGLQNKTYTNPAMYSIAIGWRWLINDNSNLIVFHDSILPKYRGFNPLVTALINGDNEIGVTALEGANDYDSGNIIKQEKISIDYPIKIKKAIDLISLCYAKLLNSILEKITLKEIKTYPQDESLVSFSLWRDEENYKIDWSLDAKVIKRFIDAIGFPYKGAYSIVNNQKIIIRDAQVVEDVKIPIREMGKVIFKDKKSYTIVCGKGLLKVMKFFDENGSEVNLKKFRIRFK
ncbi:formyltransferase family protein [Psychroflexus sp. MBR-150]|jgi:methionyl-tRNA formyltransferase